MCAPAAVRGGAYHRGGYHPPAVPSPGNGARRGQAPALHGVERCHREPVRRLARRSAPSPGPARPGGRALLGACVPCPAPGPAGGQKGRPYGKNRDHPRRGDPCGRPQREGRARVVAPHETTFHRTVGAPHPFAGADAHIGPCDIQEKRVSRAGHALFGCLLTPWSRQRPRPWGPPPPWEPRGPPWGPPPAWRRGRPWGPRASPRAPCRPR